MNQDEFFFRLTPDRVLAAVESAGFHPTGHCSALNALENRVYDVRIDDGLDDDLDDDRQVRQLRQVVAKFYRPGRWSREAILDEHRLLAALRQAEIPVCSPIPFPDGETLRRVEGIWYAIWPRTGGRSPAELRDDQVAVLGRLLARIHNVAESVAASHRERLTSASFPLRSLAVLEEGGFLPPSCARRYRGAVEEVVRIYDAWSEGVPLHPIHGDCHVGNLLQGDEGWFFLDFDDMVHGPAVHDVWMLLPGRDAEATRQRALLIDAYREFRPFDERTLRLVEPLRAFRFIFYAGWIAKRWEDPCFPDTFPHFGSEDYWETETRDLEEQVERIRRGGAAVWQGGPAESPESSDVADTPDGESQLENRDFFWDL